MYNDTDIVSRWFAVGNHPDDPMGGDPGDPAPGPTTGRVGQGGVLVLEWDEVDWLVVWNMKELWLSIYIYIIYVYTVYIKGIIILTDELIFFRGVDDGVYRCIPI